MSVYLDLTPYITDTYTTFRIQHNVFPKFVIEQLKASNIPYTANKHEKLIASEHYVESIQEYVPATYAIDYIDITAPLSQTIIDKLQNFKNPENKNILNAYRQWNEDMINSTMHIMEF